MHIKDWKHIITGFRLTENPQKSHIAFSHAFSKKGGDTLYRTMCFVKCRDYFNEHFAVLQGQKNQADVYGFNPKKKRPRGYDRDYLIVYHPDPERVVDIIRKVNHKLEEVQMEPLLIIDVEKDCSIQGTHDKESVENLFVLDMPDYWWNNAFNLHLLTYIIRYEDTDGVTDEILRSQKSFFSTKNPYIFLSVVKKTPNLRAPTTCFVGIEASGSRDAYSLHNAGLCFHYRAAAAERKGYPNSSKISKYLLGVVKNV